MTANPIWIAGYFGPVAGASPVWIAPGDGTVPSAVQSEVVSYYAPVAGATVIWIAGFFAPPPAAIGATSIRIISGWGGGGAASFPAGAAAIYSMRKVGAGYNGPCLNVIRTTDGAQQDIGFASNGMLDGAAAAAFAGAGQLFVVTWYDQSGNGRNAAQSTNASRPHLVFMSGVPYLSFPHTEQRFHLSTNGCGDRPRPGWGFHLSGLFCQLNSDLGPDPGALFRRDQRAGF